MICKTYNDLSLPEKVQLTGKVIHLLQNNEEICNSIMSIVRSAENNGLLDNVTILPEQKIETE